MQTVETSETNLTTLQSLLREALNRILDSQNEMAHIKKQLDIAVQNATKQSFPFGELVSAEKLIAVKEISELYTMKSEANENLVRQLYHLIFPDDIFISQDYFDVWVQVDSKTVVNFDDMSFLEIKNLDDLN